MKIELKIEYENRIEKQNRKIEKDQDKNILIN